MTHTYLCFLFGDLGDAILTVPALRALRITHPDARLVLLSKPVAAEYLRRLDLVDEIVLVDKHVFDRPAALLQPRAALSLFRLVCRLRRLRADTVVLFHHLVTTWGTLKFAVLALATGAGRRVGLDNGKGWFLTEAVRDRGFGARHEVEYWLDVAALLGAEGEADLEFASSREEQVEAEALLAEVNPTGRPLVAIHPGTGWYGPGRQWFPERFAAVIQGIRRRTGAECVLVGSEQDVVAAEAVQVSLGCERAASLVGRTTLGTLGAVLEQADVVLANDGGVAHLAAAAGAETVVVFGPSNDRAWRPLGATIVVENVPCRPCFYRDFEVGLRFGCATRECLDLISSRRVTDVVVEKLQAAGATAAG